MKINERIKDLRESLGITQEQLAEKTGYKSRSAINKIESGLRDINQSQIVSFATALNVSPTYLMGWEGEFTDPATNTDVFAAIGYEIKTRGLNPSPLYENFNWGKEYIDLTLKGEENNHDCFVIRFLKLLNIDLNDFWEKYSIEKWRVNNFFEGYADQFDDTTETDIITKYRKLDERGQHTVETVLDMEHNRCTQPVLKAAHELPDATEEDKQFDDDIMDDDNF